MSITSSLEPARVKTRQQIVGLVDKKTYTPRFVNQGVAMIHHRIHRARMLRGLSLEALAHSLGDISKQALNKFEKGDSKPNSTRILQLAKALNVKPEYFFRSDAIQLAPLEFRKLSKMSQARQASVREKCTITWSATKHWSAALTLTPLSRSCPHNHWLSPTPKKPKWRRNNCASNCTLATMPLPT